jgi:hypothetical protein
MERSPKYQSAFAMRFERFSSLFPSIAGNGIGNCAVILLVALTLMGNTMNSASAQEIWFSPYGRSKDLMSLFTPSAPWGEAASAIRAFEISDELVYDNSMSDDDLRRIFDDLRRRHIDLVIGIGAVTAEGGKNTCGYSVEGYALESTLPYVLQRIKSLGGYPKFFSLDEPLYFGHRFERAGDTFGCRLPIGELAKQMAEKLRQIRLTFPAASFVDVEPFPLAMESDSAWLADLANWYDAFEEAAGEKFAFFRVDMAWNAKWRDYVPSLLGLLHEKGIPLQLIYNGNGEAKSNEDWIASAVQHFKSYESDGRLPPQVAVIQSWNQYPSQILPETVPTTMTALLDRYVEWRRSR